MPSYNIELNNKPISGTKEFTLLLRITVDRKLARLKLDYSVTKKQFNPRPQQNRYVRSTHPRHATINSEIDRRIQEAKDAVNELYDEGKLVNAKTIKARLLKPKSTSFLIYSENYINDLKRKDKIASAKKHNVVLNKLKEYLSGEDLVFQEISLDFLSRFQDFLVDKGNNSNTIHNNFTAFRTIYYKAIEEGKVKQVQNPFFSFKLKQASVERIRLTESEILEISILELPERSLIWNIRNAFIFSFYCAGIRASDTLLMKWKNIVDGRLLYQMHKTKMHHSIILVDQAKSILELYEKNDPEHFIFPFFNNESDYSDAQFLFNQISAKTALLNKYLKMIAKKAGIEKKISTHTARHSFADMARKMTSSIYDISKTLGHSNTRTTEGYIAPFDKEAVDNTVQKVSKHSESFQN